MVTGIAVLLMQTHEKKAFQNTSLHHLTETQTEVSSETKVRHLETLANLPSVGFRNIVADIGFIQFLQYFGDTEVRRKVGYSLSADFFKPVLNHDPFYREFYLFLSGSSTLYAGTPEKTTQLMSEGLSYLSPNQPSDSYYIWRYKAVDELLFLGDGAAAQRSFEMAADWAQQSSDPAAQQISDMSQRSADFLANNPESKTAQIDAWSSLLTTALDSETQERAIKRIQALGGEVSIDENGSVSVKYPQEEQDSES